MSKVRIVWREGLWEVEDGEFVLTFGSASDAWAYKHEREKDKSIWQRLRRVK